eukprot:c19530_g1_i1.p1 GENE.c19530_g1_i1~~c19530_g1_i1.p1  ORF type:complete len:405 (-),score=105.53 c19530_g1_i1:24-1238(-)
MGNFICRTDNDRPESEKLSVIHAAICFCLFLPRILLISAFLRIIGMNKSALPLKGEMIVRSIKFFSSNCKYENTKELVEYLATLRKRQTRKDIQKNKKEVWCVNKVLVERKLSSFPCLKALWVGTKDWETAKQEKNTKLIFHLHGGGYCFGSESQNKAWYFEWISQYNKLINNNHYSNDNHNNSYNHHHKTNETFGIFSLRYSLAPQNKHPCAISECIETFQWLVSSCGFSSDSIILSGDSAGGGLALICALQLKAQLFPLPAALILCSPWVDHRCETDSYIRNEKTDFISKRAARLCTIDYLGHENLEQKILDPTVSPILDPGLSTLSIPTLLTWGGGEVFADDCEKLSKILNSESEANCEIIHHKDMPHCYIIVQGLGGEPQREGRHALVEFCYKIFKGTHH